jgi:hypothetical protein
MQGQLFFDSIYDAMGSAILAAGGYKKVAGKLWPSLKSETAYARLKNALDETKAEKLALCEVMNILRMAAENGDSSVLSYVAGEFGFGLVEVNPKDEAVELQRQIADGMDALNKRFARLERVQGRK